MAIDTLQPYTPNISAPDVKPVTNTTSGGARQVYDGASPPAAPDDPTLPALFYPDLGGSLLQWDVTGQAWV